MALKSTGSLSPPTVHTYNLKVVIEVCITGHGHKDCKLPGVSIHQCIDRTIFKVLVFACVSQSGCVKLKHTTVVLIALLMFIGRQMIYRMKPLCECQHIHGIHPKINNKY